ncbi:hypothetical protein M405DRAFT_846461 [Rhizopogon salebrosus TDB-379]|nr:hypothetical protein M405DRAFT_846461 [Rhizopogon salebrosus TDB-379]
MIQHRKPEIQLSINSWDEDVSEEVNGMESLQALETRNTTSQTFLSSLRSDSADVVQCSVNTTTASMGPVTVVEGEALWRCLDHAGRDGDVCAQEASTLVFSAMHQTLNTRVPGTGGRPFQAMHLSWYNWHCTSGHDAPTEVQPWLLEKEGMQTKPWARCMESCLSGCDDWTAMIVIYVWSYPSTKNMSDKLDKEKGQCGSKNSDRL